MTAIRSALVVDDTSVMRLLVGHILREAGFEVVEDTNGADALKDYNRIRPTVVVMDLNMDGIPGAVALKGILQIDPHARVVICSSTSDAHIVVDLLRSGARGYITKPFTKQKLLDTINGALDHDHV